MTVVSKSDEAIKPVLLALLKLLEVSELQAKQQQTNHTTQLKTIESALSQGQSVDIPKALGTFSDIITTVADNTASLIQVNNELVQSHKEQKEDIDRLISSVETYTSRMNVLAIATKNQTGVKGLDNVFGQIESSNLAE